MDSSEQAKLCPACSEEMIEGYFVIVSPRPGCLMWKSADKQTYKQEKLVYIKERYRTVHKRISLDLPIRRSCVESEEKVVSYYCPKCGRVDASFQVDKKDVSL